jgi:hypothetical protein
LSPCHSRSSGLAQILSSRCIVCRLLESSNNYMWLRSSFLSYPTTFLTFKRTISSCLHATVIIVDVSKSYQVDVLCVDYPSHLKLHVVTKYFSILSHYFPYLYHNYIILAPCHIRSSGQTHILSNGCIVLRLSESFNCNMWFRRTISSCLLATIEVVDRAKSAYITQVIEQLHMVTKCFSILSH